MDFIANYWMIILLGVAVVAVVGYSAYTFFKMPSDAQYAQIKEWLLYAVAQAEKELGGGTGQLKLRYVYDMFIAKFNYLAKVISFEAFSLMVDEVLDKFRALLESNQAVKAYIEE